MKNKNLALLTLILALYPDCTIDHNEVKESTTVTSPDGNCSVTVSTGDYEWISEDFPNEGELAEEVGVEDLTEGNTIEQVQA